jgi:dTDP-4-dehydrorhamnose 3,5-epimerase
VVSGEVQVALVDLRAGSGDPSTETFVLSGERPTTLFLPPGVAHGFLALTEVHLMYWMTELYDGSDEHGIAWDDSRLAIEWKIADPLVSQRDRLNKGLDWAEIPTFS